MLLKCLVRQQALNAESQVLLLVEVSILLVLHPTAQPKVLHQVQVHLARLLVLHLGLLVLLHLLLQADRLPLVQVTFLLDLLVLLHPEALAALLVALLRDLPLPAQVTPQVILLAVPPVLLHLVRPLRALVTLQAPLRVLHQVALLVRRLLMRLAEVPVHRQVTLQVAHPANPHLEVSTLVAHHPTVLL